MFLDNGHDVRLFDNHLLFVAYQQTIIRLSFFACFYVAVQRDEHKPLGKMQHSIENSCGVQQNFTTQFCRSLES
jgi:hypothetical protein